MLAQMDQERVHEMLTESAQSVAAFAGTDCARVAVKMLDALAAGYMLDMLTCKPESVPHYQACARQALALAKVFEGETMASPRI